MALTKKPKQNESVMMGAKKVRLVRGGSICNPGDKAPAMMKGSMQSAMCVSTPGADPRPRYRVVGKLH